MIEQTTSQASATAASGVSSGEGNKLRAALKSRHLTMMSIAGVIGGALFVGSGSVIRDAGPAAVLAYLAGGILVILIMRMLGEMATASPDTGSFSTYAERAIGRWAGFTIGWLYWWFWAILMAWEAFIAGTILNGWFPIFSIEAYTLVLSIALASVNFFGVRHYGEFEFWFALIKVIAIVCFISVGLLAVTHLWPLGEVSGISNLTAHGGFMPNGINAVVVAMLGVMFAFLGVEIVTIAASEAENPARQIIKATNSVVWRICLFYIGSIFLIVCLVPWNDPLLGQPGYGSYRRTLELLGVPHAEFIMNFVVLTSVSSCLISAHYTSSRMLYALGKRGDAPRIFSIVTTSTAIPVFSVIGSCAISILIALVSLMGVVQPKDILDILMNTTGMIALLVYLVIAFSQLRMRRKLDAAGTKVPLKMWFFPWMTYAVIVFIVGALISMAFVPEYRTLVISTGAAAALTMIVGIIVERKAARQTRS